MEAIIILVAIIGYTIFVFEHPLKINKAATALITAGLCWTLFMFSGYLPKKIIVEANVPGYSAEDVDAQVTAVLEENLGKVKDVDYITTKSSEGKGVVTISFKESAKMTEALSSVKAGAEVSKDLMPKSAVIEKLEIENTTEFVNEELGHHLSEIAAILFFLIGAMTIVELIDSHQGFRIITDLIKTSNARTLLWVISFITFFLSSALDNLTTAIVMVSLLRKIIADANTRRFYAGMVIIAANSGGAWSPIGDVTTTMLWIGGQISASNIMVTLIIPSLISMIIPLIVVTFTLKGNLDKPELSLEDQQKEIKGKSLVFYTGILGLVFVPVFKTITHLPPYIGMLIALAVVWVISEIIHFKEDEEQKKHYSPIHALAKIDVASILFFMGILLMIGCLQSMGILRTLAESLDKSIGNMDIIAVAIGLASAVIDNVPLVAAAIGMYDLQQLPMDSKFWEFLAFTAGTGGSILIIGSAAGVAVMGMEKIDFMWYMRKISLYALIGYFAGALAYMVVYPFFAVHH
jgi:Na+/H+ antiporter NhaD/arsenite permease-like protein